MPWVYKIQCSYLGLNSCTLSGPAYFSILICITLPLTHSLQQPWLPFCSSNMPTMFVKCLQWLLSLLKMLCTARISMAYSLPHYLSSLTECKLLEDKKFLSLLWHTVNAKQISDVVEQVNKWHVSIKILSKTAVIALEEGCNMVSFLHVGFVLLEGNHTAHTTLNNSVWE